MNKPDIQLHEGVKQSDETDELAYGWNGMKPDGGKFGLDPYRFVSWALIYHPDEYLTDSGLLKKHYMVLTEQDAEDIGEPSLAGTVAVTVKPPTIPTYYDSAILARDTVEDPKLKEAFQKLADGLKEAGFDKTP